LGALGALRFKPSAVRMSTRSDVGPCPICTCNICRTYRLEIHYPPRPAPCMVKWDGRIVTTFEIHPEKRCEYVTDPNKYLEASYPTREVCLRKTKSVKPVKPVKPVKNRKAIKEALARVAYLTKGFDE